MSLYENTIERLERKSATIAVIGLGYAGFPSALAFAESGVRVVGIDADPRIVEAIREGRSHLAHIDHDRVLRARAEFGLEAYGDFEAIGEVDGVLLCAPTPLTLEGLPDLACLCAMAESVATRIRRGALICVESTTYPGATRAVVGAIFSKAGLVPGEDVFLAHAPEREDPGSSHRDAATVPKVVGGLTPSCGRLAEALYRHVNHQVHRVNSPEVAESAKLLENMFRAVNIGFINEIKTILDRMEIDVWEVVQAAATKPFGFMPFYPGPGVGGHCIPIDPYYFTHRAGEFGVRSSVLEAALAASREMPAYVVSEVAERLAREGIGLRGAKILVLGLAYKPEIGDTRESPGLAIMELLVKEGAQVVGHDPFVAVDSVTSYEVLSNLDIAALADADAVILATNHAVFDYPPIERHAKILVDPHGHFRKKDLGAAKSGRWSAGERVLM
ncbi:MAG: nucleotide sugar dehydrogenase [Fimbriimonas sp.]